MCGPAVRQTNTHTHFLLHSLVLQPLRTDSVSIQYDIYVRVRATRLEKWFLVSGGVCSRTVHSHFRTIGATRLTNIYPGYICGAYTADGVTPGTQWKAQCWFKDTSWCHSQQTQSTNNKKERCVIPPIGTMEREYEVAITIFSIVQRLPQINQTAGENTHWGGFDLCGGGS